MSLVPTAKPWFPWCRCGYYGDQDYTLTCSFCGSPNHKYWPWGPVAGHQIPPICKRDAIFTSSTPVSEQVVSTHPSPPHPQSKKSTIIPGMAATVLTTESTAFWLVNTSPALRQVAKHSVKGDREIIGPSQSHQITANTTTLLEGVCNGTNKVRDGTKPGELTGITFKTWEGPATLKSSYVM